MHANTFWFYCIVNEFVLHFSGFLYSCRVVSHSLISTRSHAALAANAIVILYSTSILFQVNILAFLCAIYDGFHRQIASLFTWFSVLTFNNVIIYVKRYKLCDVCVCELSFNTHIRSSERVLNKREKNHFIVVNFFFLLSFSQSAGSKPEGSLSTFFYWKD